MFVSDEPRLSNCRVRFLMSSRELIRNAFESLSKRAQIDPFLYQVYFISDPTSTAQEFR